MAGWMAGWMDRWLDGLAHPLNRARWWCALRREEGCFYNQERVIAALAGSQERRKKEKSTTPKHARARCASMLWITIVRGKDTEEEGGRERAS